MGFVDDINLEGELSSVAGDVQAIIDSNPTTGLVLNARMCEITAKNFEMIDKFSICLKVTYLNLDARTYKLRHTHTYTNTQTRKHTHMYSQKHTQIHKHASTQTHKHPQTHTQTHTNKIKHTNTHKYMHKHIRTQT